MKKAKTYIERQKENHLLTKLAIMETIKIDDITYNQIQYDTAIDWIRQSEMASLEKILIGIPLFWKWWRSIYHLYDTGYLEEYLPFAHIDDFESYINTEQAVSDYFKFHSTKPAYFDDITCKKMQKEVVVKKQQLLTI